MNGLPLRRAVLRFDVTKAQFREAYTGYFTKRLTFMILGVARLKAKG